MAREASFKESVDLMFDRVAATPGLADQIKANNNVYQVRFFVKFRDSYRIFTGWRATHNEHRLPVKGRIRSAPYSGPRRCRGTDDLDGLQLCESERTVRRRQGRPQYRHAGIQQVRARADHPPVRAGVDQEGLYQPNLERTCTRHGYGYPRDGLDR